MPGRKLDRKGIHSFVDCLRPQEKTPLNMRGDAAEAAEGRKLLRRMAANLVRRAAKPSLAELMVDADGHIGMSVRGVFAKLEPCNDPGSLASDKYVKRIFDFFGCGHDVYVIALVYIDRLFKRHPDLTITLGDVNKWLLASLILAIKWHEEVCNQYPDQHYANVGGVTFAEFCLLEARLLGLLGWELHVTSVEFCAHCFLAMALSPQVGLFSAASSCTTSMGCSPADSEDENVGHRDDDLDEEDCLRGKPLWSAQSYMTRTKEIECSDDSDEDDCLTGKPLWSAQSYITCAKEREENEEEKEEGPEDEG